jgi:hypothetical protein
LLSAKLFSFFRKWGKKEHEKSSSFRKLQVHPPKFCSAGKQFLKELKKNPNNIQSLDLPPHYFVKAFRDLESLRACSLVPQANPSFLASFSRMCSALDHQALRGSYGGPELRA